MKPLDAEFTPRLTRPGATVASSSHLVLIPSFNAGPKAVATVRDVRRHWHPVWVVVDGSTDGSGEALMALAREDRGVRVWRLPRNNGKGAAILRGLQEALAAGFTHVLTMDSDGQHPADRIAELMNASLAHPEAVVLGDPIFDERAPRERVLGRKLSNAWTRIETLGAPIGDSLFGFRVYPVAPLLAIMERTRWMRRFDFDAEAAVRLAWAGSPLINVRVPVHYFTAAEGGVSHFRYVRDNILLTWMHARLIFGCLLRLPRLLVRRLTAKR